MVQLIEDFEIGGFTSEFIVRNNINVQSDPPFVYKGTYSMRMKESSGAPPPLGRYEPNEFSGGVQPNYVEFYSYEAQTQFGGAITINDSNGNIVTAFATDNPQRKILSGGSWNFVQNTGNYGVWVRTKIEFNFSSNNVTYTVEELSTGAISNQTFSMENPASDIRAFEFREFTNNSFGSGKTLMWWDNFKVDGISSTKSANVLVDSINSTSNNSVDATGQVDSQSNITDADLGFNVYESGGSTVVSSNTVEYGVDLTTQTIPRNFTGTVSGLQSSKNYEIEAFVQDFNDTEYKSGRTSFQTTQSFINPDFVSNIERFTMATQSGVVKYDLSMDFRISKDVSSSGAFNNIKNKILTQFKNGTNIELTDGVVLDNGTVVKRKNINKSSTDANIEAEFSLVESDTSTSDTLTDFEIEDNNGNKFYGSEIAETDGGQTIILFVNIESE